MLVNFAAFQLVWFLSLLGAGSGRHWLGTAAFGVFFAAHLALSGRLLPDGCTALACAGCGFVLDSFYVRFGLLEYAAPLPLAGFAPYWIVVMWSNFGLTLNSSLRWLQRHLWLGALCGAAGGPLAYLAGVKLGAAVLTAPPAVVYGALAVTWAGAVPGLLALAARTGKWGHS